MASAQTNISSSSSSSSSSSLKQIISEEGREEPNPLPPLLETNHSYTNTSLNPPPLSDQHQSSADSSSKESKPSKIVWGKSMVVSSSSSSSDGGIGCEPAPVMGALSNWPALSETRNVKAPEPIKLSSSAQQKTPLKDNNSQASSTSRNSGNGGNLSTVRRQNKPLNQHDISSNGISSSTALTPPYKTASSTAVHSPDADNEDRNSRGMRDTIGVHSRGNTTNAISNNIPGNRRNFMRDQGRGNHGWNSHGRGYPNGRETNVPFQQQRVGPRNLPRPFFPYMNPNPQFVNAVGYQTVPGGMYYMPAPPPPDHFLGPTYFAPPPVGMFMQGPVPDPTALQSSLVKQIEYYFSVENLCRDMYLRSNMDDQGFVPVSIIASFNRVRKITTNAHFILDALRASSVLEVQGDRIRKRDDWVNWLIPSSQRSVGGLPDRNQNVWTSHPSQNAEDELRKSERLAQDIGVGHRNPNARIYGVGSMESGGNTPPNDVIQHLDFFTSSDDDRNNHATLPEESHTLVEDKSDLQRAKLYGIE